MVVAEVDVACPIDTHREAGRTSGVEGRQGRRGPRAVREEAGPGRVIREQSALVGARGAGVELERNFVRRDLTVRATAAAKSMSTPRSRARTFRTQRPRRPVAGSCRSARPPGHRSLASRRRTAQGGRARRSTREYSCSTRAPTMSRPRRALSCHVRRLCSCCSTRNRRIARRLRLRGRPGRLGENGRDREELPAHRVVERAVPGWQRRFLDWRRGLDHAPVTTRIATRKRVSDAAFGWKRLMISETRDGGASSSTGASEARATARLRRIRQTYSSRES